MMFVEAYAPTNSESKSRVRNTRLLLSVFFRELRKSFPSYGVRMLAVFDHGELPDPFTARTWQ